MTPAETDALLASASSSTSAAARSGNVPAVDAAVPQLAEFEQTGFSHGEVPIGMLLDLSLPVSIELGRTTMTVQELLRLGRGSVVQLDRLAGEPIDIFVGDKRFAEGEVVVLGEHFGIRITRIVSAAGIGGSPVA
jgi:flagellar motor switch protein FliN/FliY